MEQMNKTKLYLIPDDSFVSYIRNVIGTIVRPKVGVYYIYRNNLLKIVSANNCEGCFFFHSKFCKLMFIEKGRIHCDYDSHINFLFMKNIIDEIL